jgi:hypothetical protein
MHSLTTSKAWEKSMNSKPNEDKNERNREREWWEAGHRGTTGTLMRASRPPDEKEVHPFAYWASFGL